MHIIKLFSHFDKRLFIILITGRLKITSILILAPFIRVKRANIQ